jgi:hypothetical protein
VPGKYNLKDKIRAIALLAAKDADGIKARLHRASFIAYGLSYNKLGDDL